MTDDEAYESRERASSEADRQHERDIATQTASRCPVHDGAVHGGEAEELRAGIEALLGDDIYVDVRRTDLLRLLDRVNARDSLAHLERQDTRVVELEAAVERMAPVIAAADAWLDDPCKGLGSHRESDLAAAVKAYRAKVTGAAPAQPHAGDPDHFIT